MNNNNFGLSDEQIENMLNNVSRQMGVDKDQLRQNLQEGKMDSIMDNNQNGKKAQILKMMQNKKLMDKFLQSKQAMDLMKKLSKEL